MINNIKTKKKTRCNYWEIVNKLSMSTNCSDNANK